MIPPEDALGSDEEPRDISRSLPKRVAMRIIRRPYEWAKRPWPDDRVVQSAFTIATLVVTTFIMMRVVHWSPLSGQADLINDDTTPTGGDMGAHVWAPAFLRDHLLPNWQLSGWSMDWYGGLPIYRFYMVIPALLIVALDTVLPYGVAFKYVVILGSITLPFCCWAFGRLARFRYPMPELFAFAALCFLLRQDGPVNDPIYGGDVLATMAGEFSFSLALSLTIVGLGLLARALDDGAARVLVWAGTVLALACLSHGIVLIYTAVGAVVIVVCRCGADLGAWVARRSSEPGDPAAVSLEGEAKTVFLRRLTVGISAGLLTLLLAAFWVGPFVFDHDYMTDMKYGPRPEGPTDSFWVMLFDQEPVFDFLINSLALAGLAAAMVRRHVYGVALGLIGLIAMAMVYLARDSLPVIGLLWNPRVLPWLYLVRYLMMMVGIVEVAGLLVNFVRNRAAQATANVGERTVVASGVALVVLIIFGFVFQVLPGGSRVGDQYAWGPIRSPHGFPDAQSDGWAAFNFNGYEGITLYPEYYNVVQEMDRVGEEQGCGRALWEHAPQNGSYGTTMALMLLPFWTDGCIGSMEGLFFEASGSTPYHFLTAAAMSRQASNPVRELRYVNNDAAVGVEHLQALGVRYVIVSTHEGVAQAAAQPDLVKIAESGPWRIYEVAESDIVVPLDVQPVVVNGRSGDRRERYLELGTSWFQNQGEWAAMPANDGPDEWQHIDVEVDLTREVPDPARPPGLVDDPATEAIESSDLRNPQVSVVTPVQEIDVVTQPEIEVSDVDIEQQSVSFDVSQVGVPVLVRVGYFPNWEVDGADGPYRIGPNQMVVVPTDTHVRLHYDRSTTDLLFYALTLVGIALAIYLRTRGDPKVSAPAPSEAQPAT